MCFCLFFCQQEKGSYAQKNPEMYYYYYKKAFSYKFVSIIL